jgi:lysophospholipase L1-like esterase
MPLEMGFASPMKHARGSGGLAVGVLVGSLLVLGTSTVVVLVVPTPLSMAVSGHIPGDGRRSVVAESVLTTVVGLGDSVPAGDACDCTSYVVQLGAGTGGDSPMAVDNEAVGGQTSAGLLQQVRGQGITAHRNQVTLVTIGANDFDAASLAQADCQGAGTLVCYRSSLTGMGDNVRALLGALRAGADATGPVLVTGYWNVFLDGDVAAANGHAYVRDSDSLTRAVNEELQQASAALGATYVDLYGPFKAGGDDSGLLAADGDHPSEAGHALIASLVRHQLSLLRRAG